jgi:hypothetical protein
LHRLSDKRPGFFHKRRIHQKRPPTSPVVMLTNLTESFDLPLSNKNQKKSFTRGSDFKDFAREGSMTPRQRGKHPSSASDSVWLKQE